MPWMSPSPQRDRRRASLSNLDKVFWPAEGYTKTDLVEYYRAISPWLLPYLRDRPLMLTRYPDGIHGKSFFQKALPLKAPRFVRSVRVRNEDIETLFRIVPLGTPVYIYSAALIREAFTSNALKANQLPAPATPITLMKRLELILGKIVPYIMIGLIQVTLILLAARYVFNVPMRAALAPEEYVEALWHAVVAATGEFQPDLIFTHSKQDVHQDHNTMTDEALRAFRGITRTATSTACADELCPSPYRCTNNAPCGNESPSAQLYCYGP